MTVKPLKMASSVVARAPAKINVVLRVGPRRRDGFHSVATIYHAVSLYDEVEVRPAPAFAVSVEGTEAAGVPTDESNLALRAARLLASHAGLDEAGSAVQIVIHKSIPVAAGLAGGSADAAAALVACDALWQTKLARDDLLAVAAQLGSDVPFALAGGTAVGTGRGELLAPTLGRGRLHWLLAFAEGGLSTPEVYGRLDSLRDGHDVPAPVTDAAALLALRSGDARALGPTLANDLQPATLALAPALRGVLEVGLEAGALGGLVSGSGPTVVFLARDGEHALDLAITLSAAGVCRTVKPVHGPVPGARLAPAG